MLVRCQTHFWMVSSHQRVWICIRFGHDAFDFAQKMKKIKIYSYIFCGALFTRAVNDPSLPLAAAALR